MKLNEDGTYTFDSGMPFAPNSGIIGLNPEMEMGVGYDNIIYSPDYVSNLSPIKRLEIADYMIELWGKFKAQTENELASDQP